LLVVDDTEIVHYESSGNLADNSIRTLRREGAGAAEPPAPEPRRRSRGAARMARGRRPEVPESSRTDGLRDEEYLRLEILTCMLEAL